MSAAPENLYASVASASASLVIRKYSTSFGLASRLLAEPVRIHVAHVYALVRIADEIVDNPDPGVPQDARDRMLTWLQDDVTHALLTGYSSNLVVHAFALTARECGIGHELIDPFFESMRMDLHRTTHTPESFDRYVYGSAEVVGLMCLRTFIAAEHLDQVSDYERLAPGAQRLGAAFQKINFIRDLADDKDLLHRSYFPGLDPDNFQDADRDRILDDIDADLAAADAVIPGLPGSSRPAVRAAHDTFAELATRLRATPAEQIRRQRVRVPNPVKLRIAASSRYKDRR
ncbi:squalene/phytoene synthase family protein [Yimella sp. cx-573]|nr:squalene/phytoene synthase family protein [Yimella sp. cx-573]